MFDDAKSCKRPRLHVQIGHPLQRSRVFPEKNALLLIFLDSNIFPSSYSISYCGTLSESVVKDLHGVPYNSHIARLK